jgi:hypothetical protein
MELSVKRLQNALGYYIDGGNYQYNPTKFMFDYNSDEKYGYVCYEAHYVFRVEKELLPEVLGTDLLPMINKEAPLERLIAHTAEERGHKEVFIEEIFELDKKRVVRFTDGKKADIWINARFFEQFYNKPVTKKVPDNITFTATVNKQNKSAVIMWENDEAIAMFLPIEHKADKETILKKRGE